MSKQWEYLQVFFRDSIPIQVEGISAAEDTLLKERGKHGWEMIAIRYLPSGRVFYFKRPRDEDGDCKANVREAEVLRGEISFLKEELENLRTTLIRERQQRNVSSLGKLCECVYPKIESHSGAGFCDRCGRPLAFAKGGGPSTVTQDQAMATEMVNCVLADLVRSPNRLHSWGVLRDPMGTENAVTRYSFTLYNFPQK